MVGKGNVDFQRCTEQLTVSPVWLHIIRVHELVGSNLYTCMRCILAVHVHCTLYVEMIRTIGDRSGDGFDTSENW